MKNYFLLILAIAFTLTSCSIEKRHYNKGYSLNWKNGKETVEANKAVTTPAETATTQTATQVDITEAPATLETTNTSDMAIASANDNGAILAPVATPKVATKGTVASANTNVSETKAPVATENAKITKKEAKKSSPKRGGKSQLVALLLCFFLGGLGVHRFYLGYIGIGVAQLLTAGGLGIWALIDFIRIILGTLEPKDGSYSETL